MAEIDLNYQRFFLSEFEGRRQRNPQYSLRAFARDLGIAAPKLSEILRGKGGLSEGSAKRLAGKLGLTPEESDLFVQLVVANHARSPKIREHAKAKLSLVQSHYKAKFNEISLESFKIISDWHHFAILELTEVQGFKSEISWIAKRLKIPKAMVKEAVERLFDFGLLGKRTDGTWFQTEATLATPSGLPSAEIRKHHRQILAKADEALTNVPVDERDFSSTTLAFSEEQIPEVREAIKSFRRTLAAKLAKSNKKNRVYCLSIQFFPFDEKEKSL